MGDIFTKKFWLGSPVGELNVKTGDIGLENMMRERLMGRGGPSPAELMMNRGMQQQIGAGRSMAASMRGANPGMAMRLAGQREAQTMSNVGQQMGILKAQEQEQMRQALAQYVAQQDQLRMQMAMFNAKRQQSTGMLGSVLQTGGAVLGGFLGGPSGAAAGAKIGGGVGNSGIPAPQWEDYYNPDTGMPW